MQKFKSLSYRRCFYAMTISCIITIFTAYEILSILKCDAVETKKYVFTPGHRSIQKIGKFYGLKKYSDISSACVYNSTGQINCPDVRILGESVIRQIQLVMSRMLFIFDVVCRKHEIKYWIVTGTLLGAVRDKGFVPWDNDLDVAMLREDYNKFLAVAVSDLPDDIFLQNTQTDPFYKVRQLNEAKLRDRRSCYCLCLRYGCKRQDGLMVDIFVFDHKAGIYEDGWKRFKYTHKQLFPLKELVFEGFKVFVPRRYKQILYNQYGNISRPPPENRQCPTKGYIGYPWRSCEEISNMKKAEKNRIIDDSRISSDWILYYVY